MEVVLYQPQIPTNTGNIGRLCVGMQATLHLIGPLTFSLDEHARRRAGLDYWPHLSWRLHTNPDSFLEWLGERRPWVVTKEGRHRFDQPAYREDDVLIMGNEARGIPEAWRQRWGDRGVFIPILGPIRSYNLANATAIVLSHATLAAGGFGPR